MRRLFACHHSSHAQFLKEQMYTSQVNVASHVSQELLRQQERCSSRHNMQVQYSIDPSNSNREYGQSPGFQCLIVTKTEGRSRPSRAGPSACSGPIFVCVPTFREYFVQSRNVSILCQSLPSQCNLGCSDLLRNRQRMMFSPLHRLWALVFLCLGIRVPKVPSRDRCGNVYVRSAL